MRILIVTDAWPPQINGVVRTYTRLREELLARGHAVEVISPDLFRTIPCPGYSEIRLAVGAGAGVRRRIEAFAPDAIHLATEGPLGFAARRHCLRHGLPFTTSYTTRFPEYLSARLPVPLSWGYAVMRRFHGPSRAVMVSTASMRRELETWGLRNLVPWTRGVDTDLFRPGLEPALRLPRPVHLYVGRVAVEKNIDAFLRLELPGSKLVVGDGPQRAELQRRHPDAVFVGAKQGEELARHYAAGDLFVFPSRTDTFGLVMLEALASGLPVAAFPVPGPLDVVEGQGIGVLDEDLGYAIERARAIPAERCRAHALKYRWSACAELFLSQLAPIPARQGGALPSGLPLPEKLL